MDSNDVIRLIVLVIGYVAGVINGTFSGVLLLLVGYAIGILIRNFFAKDSRDERL